MRNINQKRSDSTEMPKRTAVVIPLDNREPIMHDTPANFVRKEYSTNQVGTAASRDVRNFVNASDGFGAKRNHNAASNYLNYASSCMYCITR